MENQICWEVSRMGKIYKGIRWPEITDTQGAVACSGYIWNSELGRTISLTHHIFSACRFNGLTCRSYFNTICKWFLSQQAGYKIHGQAKYFVKCWESPLVDSLLVQPSFPWQWDLPWALASPSLWISAPQKPELPLNPLHCLLTSCPKHRVSYCCGLSLGGIFHSCADVFWVEGFYPVDSQHHT